MRRTVDTGMRWQEAVEYMRSHPEVCLQEAQNGGYVCPCCGSGSGAHKTGIQKSRIENRFTCFSTKKYADGCFRAADIIQIMAVADGIVHDFDEIRDHNNYEKWNEAVINAAENHFGIQINEEDLRRHSGDYQYQHRPRPAYHPRPATPPPPQEPTPEEKYANEVIPKDIEEAQKYQDPTGYLAKRGLSKETQAHFHCGFLPKWISPKVRYRKEHGKSKAFGTPRVIIPTGKCSYLARDTRDPEYIRGRARDYVKMKAGSHAEFNWQVAKNKNGIFVTEGEIDAMSIYEAGQKNVLALGSTAYIRGFIDYLQKNHIKGKTFYVCLDRDQAGRTASDAFIQRLKECGNLGIDSSSIILEGTKDANESLVKDRVAFVTGLAKKVKMLNVIARRASAVSR